MEIEKRKLGEFVDSVSDTTLIKKEKIILINTSDIENGKVLNHTYTNNNNLKGQFKKRFKENDILYSEIRPKNRRFAYIDFNSEDYIASTKLMVLRSRKNIDNNYLYQLLKSDTVINYLQGIAESRSGTFPQITFAELANIDIFVPNLINQKRISYILGKIDDKIDLNNHTNDNLLELASCLIDDNYSNSDGFDTLSSIIKFVKGKKPKHIDNIKHNDYEKYLTIACLNNQELNYAANEKMILSNNNILMVMDGASSGDVYFNDYGIVGSTLARVDLIDKKYLDSYIYFILRKHQGLIKSKNTGSAIPHTDKVFVGTLEVPIIEKEEQEKYKKLVDKLLEIRQENQALTQLRDTLLPKLMNGEIDLENIEI